MTKWSEKIKIRRQVRADAVRQMEKQESRAQEEADRRRKKDEEARRFYSDLVAKRYAEKQRLKEEEADALRGTQIAKHVQQAEDQPLAQIDELETFDASVKEAFTFSEEFMSATSDFNDDSQLKETIVQSLALNAVK